MSTLSFISMVLNLTIVIGGFIFFLMKSIRHERTKEGDKK